VTVDTLYYFMDSARLARSVARALGVPARGVDVHRFPDRESLVHLPEIDGPRAVLLRPLHDPNNELFEVLLAADALGGGRRGR